MNAIRTLLVAATAAACVFAAPVIATAAELPAKFLGEWTTPTNDTLTILPSGVSQVPGGDCKVDSIRNVSSYPVSSDVGDSIIDMTCNLEDARRPTKIREIWSVSNIAGKTMLITAQISGTPHIAVWLRH
jgi:hypothetical protein